MKKKSEHIERSSGFPKLKTGYTVPEGYFESFGERLNCKMEAEQRPLRTNRALFYLRPALGLVASLAVILTVYLHPFGFQQPKLIPEIQNSTEQSGEDQTDALSSTYASLVTDGQFFSALNEMDEYDSSKISKDGLADYLASSCSDLEIINANK